LCQKSKAPHTPGHVSGRASPMRKQPKLGTVLHTGYMIMLLLVRRYEQTFHEHKSVHSEGKCSGRLNQHLHPTQACTYMHPANTVAGSAWLQANRTCHRHAQVGGGTGCATWWGDGGTCLIKATTLPGLVSSNHCNEHVTSLSPKPSAS